MLVTLISFDGKSVFERIFSFRELCSDELVSSTLLNRNLKDSIVKSRTNDYFAPGLVNLVSCPQDKWDFKSPVHYG